MEFTRLAPVIRCLRTTHGIEPTPDCRVYEADTRDNVCSLLISKESMRLQNQYGVENPAYEGAYKKLHRRIRRAKELFA